MYDREKRALVAQRKYAPFAVAAKDTLATAV
jgi:hypothetical protein